MPLTLTDRTRGCLLAGSVGDARFERQWAVDGPEIRARLRRGGSILVHCRGGLGRTGLLGARLLVELGMTPDAAIQRVRSVRHHAIETSAQEAHVRQCRRIE